MAILICNELQMKPRFCHRSVLFREAKFFLRFPFLLPLRRNDGAGHLKKDGEPTRAGKIQRLQFCDKRIEGGKREIGAYIYSL